jgi:hypothetical protein
MQGRRGRGCGVRVASSALAKWASRWAASEGRGRGRGRGRGGHGGRGGRGEVRCAVVGASGRVLVSRKMRARSGVESPYSRRPPEAASVRIPTSTLTLQQAKTRPRLLEAPRPPSCHQPASLPAQSLRGALGCTPPHRMALNLTAAYLTSPHLTPRTPARTRTHIHTQRCAACPRCHCRRPRCSSPLGLQHPETRQTRRALAPGWLPLPRSACGHL